MTPPCLNRSVLFVLGILGLALPTVVTLFLAGPVLVFGRENHFSRKGAKSAGALSVLSCPLFELLQMVRQSSWRTSSYH